MCNSLMCNRKHEWQECLMKWRWRIFGSLVAADSLGEVAASPLMAQSWSPHIYSTIQLCCRRSQVPSTLELPLCRTNCTIHTNAAFHKWLVSRLHIVETDLAPHHIYSAVEPFFKSYSQFHIKYKRHKKVKQFKIKVQNKKTEEVEFKVTIIRVE